MTAIQRDTIEVRTDERFDEQRLAGYLRGRLPGSDGPLSVRQFGGGAANLTYLLDYGGHEYVLRRPPLGPVAQTAHDMAREYKVLSVLYGAYPFAPRAYLFCDDADVIGAEFLVMERRHGVVVRRALPAIFGGQPYAPRRMSEALVAALAALHAVDYSALGLDDLGRPQGFVARQVEGWYGRWQKARLHDLPEMDAAYAWLRANIPTGAGFSLVHNDYKLDNVMLSSADAGQVVAVFDWDMCTLGDPLCDLGALLTYWSEPADPPYLQATAMMPVGDLGFPNRGELVRIYAEQSGRRVQDIHFYHTLGLFRLTVIAAQIFYRYKKGQTRDERFAAFETMIPLLARRTMELPGATTA
jgi:aminoglycoside phosphotransferase (APT) family kinase protein